MSASSLRNRARDDEASVQNVTVEGLEVVGDDEDRTEPKSTLFVAFLQIFLIGFSYSIVIPTARFYAGSLDAPKGFEGIMVGASSVGGILLMPLYRILLKRSFAATLHFQLVLIQFGNVLYSLAKVADSIELLVAGRFLAGLGMSFYPVYQFIAERIGKKHRSNTMALLGIFRALGFSLGPIFAAVLVYVDFNIGKLTVDKETNAGWSVAIFCAFQTALVVWFFPREGSKLLAARRTEEAEDARFPLIEKAKYISLVSFVILSAALPSFFIAAWEVSATELIQVSFRWTIQLSALLVGGIAGTPAVSAPIMGKLSYKFQDRQFLLVLGLLQLLSTVFLFDFGLAPLYLVGSLIFFNAITLQLIFIMALSSKICLPSDVEKVQSWINVISLLLRAVGAVTGAAVSVNQFAFISIAGALVTFLGTAALYRKLKVSSE